MKYYEISPVTYTQLCYYLIANALKVLSDQRFGAFLIIEDVEIFGYYFIGLYRLQILEKDLIS